MTDTQKLETLEEKKWWVNEDGDLMWRPECPGPEWQLGKEWIDE